MLLESNLTILYLDISWKFSPIFKVISFFLNLKLSVWVCKIIRRKKKGVCTSKSILFWVKNQLTSTEFLSMNHLYIPFIEDHKDMYFKCYCFYNHFFTTNAKITEIKIKKHTTQCKLYPFTHIDTLGGHDEWGHCSCDSKSGYCERRGLIKATATITI